MGVSNYVELQPLGYASVSATSSTAVLLSASLPAYNSSAQGVSGWAPNYVLVTAETAGIRWRDDGVAPVSAASGGFPIAAGSSMEYDGKLSALQFISQAGTATVHLAFYRAA